MNATSISHRIVLLALVSILSALPYLAHAQAPASDLHAVIKAELLSDPRTSGLSSDQLNAMVNILTAEAQKQGITANDITWRPARNAFGDENQAAAANMCEGLPWISCKFDEGLGFIGPDTTIPFLLGMASMGLIWIIAEMLHRKRHPMHY